MRLFRFWRVSCAALLFFCVSPAAATALSVSEARHLLARTGFGNATWAEIERLRPLSRRLAVDYLFSNARREATLRPPAWIDNKPALRPPRGAPFALPGVAKQ